MKASGEPGAGLNRGLIAAAGLLAIMTGGTAEASPYRITGMDAATHWEIKLEGKYEDTHDENVIEAPLIDLTAPLAKGLETSVTFGRGRVHEKGEPTRSGFLDTELAVKWEVAPIKRDKMVGVTIEPALILPTASHDLGDHKVQFELPVVIGWNSGPVRLRGLVGYAHSLEDHEDEMSVGALGEYKLSPSLSMGAEIVTKMPSQDIHAYDATADIGFKWELKEGVELQARAGRSIRSADHRGTTSAALYLEIAL